MPSVGEAVTRMSRSAVVDTQLKQGLFGISVKTDAPQVSSPDRPVIKEVRRGPPLAKPVVVEEIVEEVTQLK